MAAEQQAGEEGGGEIVHARRRHPAVTAAKWVGIGLLTILIVIAALLVWVNTDPGRRFIVRQINQLETASGLDIDVGRIEGSVFGEMVIHDLRLGDDQGMFFRAPRAEVDWRPFAYLRNHIDVRSLEIPLARLYRLPQLKPGDPNAPLLPDIDIDIGRLNIERLIVDPAVTGRRHLLSIQDDIHIANRRAEVELAVRALEGPGISGGDHLAFRLIAVPEENRLDIALRLQSPEDGFITGLLGLDRPLAARLEGRGTWENWRGRLRAAAGGERIAQVALAAKDGTFTVQGPVRPDLFLSGPVARLAQPFVQLNLTAALENRRADLNLRANSRALALAAEGLVDLGENRFEDFRVAARLLQPGAIGPDLRANDLRFAAILNGTFATPRVAYDLRAAQLGFGDTIVEGLHAQGGATVRSDRIIVPIAARAQRILGLDPMLGGLLTNVAINGELAVDWPHIVSDNLRIRSDRIDATAAIALDFARGSYRALLNGRIDNYRVEGVGILDLTTDLDLTTGPDGFGISGRFVARTEQIENASVRDFLGGQATVRGSIIVEPSGLIRVNDIRLASPQLAITSGSGVYRPDGTIDFRLGGRSSAYGPLTVSVSGTMASPRVRLRAESPGFGIGLRGVEADVRATAQGWAIEATGQSQYGPFSADIVILSQRGPLTIQVNRLTFAGMDFEGRLVQSPAGPFVGTLTISGNGLEGTVRLSAVGQYQRIALSADASGAQIPGEPPILIQRGIVRATAILYPDAPLIVGDAQLAGVRSGDLLIEQARARVNYRGGRGQAQLVAEGRRGVPFQIALNADLTPDLIRAAVRGEINNIPFRTAEPAIVRQAEGAWRLQPATIVLPQGRVRLAGSYGDGLVIQSRLDDLDLSILNAFAPGLGIGGNATGSLDFAQPADGAFPRAEMRLNIDDFTRTSIVTRSVPVDMAVAGSLRPEGGRLAAIIRRGGAVIGRMQARLEPLGPRAGSWMTRLMAAPLSGGVRYNGPADVLMSLANLPGHQLTGPVGVAVDFSGRVRDPEFTGLIRANNLTYVNEQFGTRITNLAVAGRFDASRLELTQLSGRAGEGTVTGGGTIGLAADAGFPIDIRLQLANARLARSDNLGGSATGTVRIVNNAQGARISGDLQLPEVRYQFVQQAAAEIPQLGGVRRRGEPLPKPGADQAEAAGVPSIWQLDLNLTADNRVFVSGMGLESEWAANLTVEGTSATPRITGSLEMLRGTLSLAGRRFRLADGDIDFTGSRPPNPRINIEALTDIDGVEVGINIGGSATNPQIVFSSSPALPQDEIVSRILFGSSVTEISAIQAIQLAASLNSLRGGGGGLNPIGELRSATGIDRLRILGADETTGRGTAIAAGMYLSDDIYIEIVTDARGFTATQLEIALSRALSLLSQFGGTSGTHVEIRYSKDY